MRYCSIDPGKKGAVAFFEDGKLLGLHPLPYQPNNAVDSVTFYKILCDYKPLNQVFIERVYMPYGLKFLNGASQMMWNYGRLLGAIEALLVKPKMITPAEWKKALKLSSDKKKSIKLCQSLYPDANLKRTAKSKECDGLAEAILIGYYCYNNYADL